MSDLRFSYSNAYDLWEQLIAFLQDAGWELKSSRKTSAARPALAILEGGKEGKWSAPPVVGIHYMTSGQLYFQGFKQRGYMDQGLTDFFEDQNIDPQWIMHLAGINVEAPIETPGHTLMLRPGMGIWNNTSQNHTFVHQGTPTQPYAIQARIASFDTFSDDGAVGIAIYDEDSNHFLRFFVRRESGIHAIRADYCDGSSVNLITQLPGPLPSTPLDLYLEQLGGVILCYYRENDGAWHYFTSYVLDEREYFPPSAEVGIFAYSDVDTWEPHFGSFIWQRYFWGYGDPLFFGGVFAINPHGSGQAVVSGDTSRFTLLTDPGSNQDAIHCGTFQDHTNSRTMDSRLCLVKPFESKLGIYSPVEIIPKAREGLNPESATAALGRPFLRTSASPWGLEEDIQIRDGRYILHPFFVGIQFDERQATGETKGLYLTGAGTAAPSNYDLLEFQGDYYLYFQGMAFGPVTPTGSESIFPALNLTWVDPELRWLESQFLPSSFKVYEGAEEPQIVVEWSEPVVGWELISDVRVLRKRFEYPRDETDGMLVYSGDGHEGGISDRVNLLLHQFYYYKMFVLKDGYGWISSSSVEGNALSWQSGWGENTIYNALPAVFRIYDTAQEYLMEFAQRSPQVINFQEGAGKGFLRRLVKNFGLEVDRIRAFLKAFERAWDPLNAKLEWLKYIGSRYFFKPYQGDPGNRQRYDLLFWPLWLRKKFTEKLIVAIVEQTLHVTPDIILGSERTGWVNRYPQTHTFNFGSSFNPGIDQGNFDKIGCQDDPNIYTHGYRTIYNMKGVFVYVQGTFTSEELAKVRTKLAQSIPLSTVLVFFVNDAPVFTLKVEDNHGTVQW